MNNIENILDLNASEIDEIIQALKGIEDLALSSDGLGQINMVIDLFENNLDGLYKKAMVEQVKVRKEAFIEVMEELRDKRIRLERYRDFLQSGAGVKVSQNQNYINVNPIDDIKNASDLELAVGTLIPRIEDDYDAIHKADNRIYELGGIIASKLRQEPPGDVSHERELISILNTNKGLFNDLDNNIPESLANTRKLPEEFDEVNKLFKTNLDNYHTVWDSTTDYKIEEVGILSGIGNLFGFGKEEENNTLEPDTIIDENGILYKSTGICGPDGKIIYEIPLSFWDNDGDGFIDMGIDEGGSIIDGSRYPLGIPNNGDGVPSLKDEDGNYYESDRRIQLMKAAGIAESDWEYVNYIIYNESGWEYTQENGTGAIGLPQMNLGGSQGIKGEDGTYFAPNSWLKDPVEQMKWANWYANDQENLDESYKPKMIVPSNHYDSWEEAYNSWKDNSANGYGWW